MPIDPKEIERYVIPNSGNQFTGDDFRLLCRPCVYLFMLNGLPLYIGMSGIGIVRSAARNHHHADLARKECDQVLIYPCLSVDAAYSLEKLLIHVLSPKYNERLRGSYTADRLGVKSYTPLHLT